MSLRVLAVNSYGADGGAERWLTELLGTSTRLDVEALLLGEGPLEKRLRALNWQVRVDPVGSGSLGSARAASRVARHLRRDRPDVVLANGIKAGVVAVPAAVLAGVPVAWARHDFSFEGWVARGVARLADRVVVTSADVGEGLGRTDLVVIPPPLSPGQVLDRASARAALGLVECPGALDLGMVGRVVGYKGLAEAVAALALPGGQRWRLVVVGDEDGADPGEPDRLRAQARELGVSERLVLCGAVPDAGRCMAAFDAVAVLTRTAAGRGPSGEGFGLSALEAMAAGVPLVVAHGGGLQARVGEAAVVVPPQDPAAVGAALQQLEDPALRERLGEAGRRRAAEHPNVAELGDQLVAALAGAARRPARVGASDVPVSVVLPLHNEGAAADDVVAALLEQLREGDELIAVDDASTDDTGRRLEIWRDSEEDRVRVIHRESNGGAAAARNDGCAIARHELVVFTDAGVRPAPGWLDSLRAALASPSTPGWVAGSYAVDARNPLEQAMAAANHPAPAELTRRPPWLRVYTRLFGQDHRVDRPPGRSMGVRRSALAEVGGWNPELRTAEEADLARRLAAARWHGELEADAVVLWRPRPTLRATWRMYVRYAEGDVQGGDRRGTRRAVVRGAAYPAMVAALTAGGTTLRVVAAAGSAAYLSVPVSRALAAPQPALVIALVPVTMAVKDLAKAYGALRAGLRRRGHR